MARIYYSDGTFSEADWPIGNLARGVQAILQEDDNGWIVTSGSDFYVKRDGRWFGVDDNGLWDFLLDSGIVMFGRTLRSNKYKAILDEALARRRELNGPT